MKKYLISDIKPYVRYARYMTLDENADLPAVIPYDARLFYTFSGSGSIGIAGKTYEMKSGDLLLFNAGTEYQIYPPRDKVTYLILNFDYLWDHSYLCNPIPPVNKSSFNCEDIVERVSFQDAAELNTPIYLSGAFRLLEGLVDIEREFTQKVMMYETRISGMLSKLTVDVLRICRTQIFAEGQERLDEIVRYVHENYALSLTNVSIGERFGFHPNYISALIKKYTGMPLHKYLIYVRISRAAEILNGSSMSIGEISEKCGFCDIYYFSGYFKRYMGCSPLEYRKMNSGISAL
ncbi:MAG: helix-turn-helix domain-containing protein [Clostridia bacterium]|nr:helix-turn-helix domain-containing protein [Clostridia bacterium]